MREIETIMTPGKFLPLIVILCVAFGIQNAMAQSHIQNSTPLDVALTFYKTADATPNYDRWTRQSEPYLSTPQAKWPQVIERQRVFLKKSYENLDTAQDLIIVKTQALAKLKNPSNPETDPMLLSFSFKHEKDNRELFFPYDYGGDHFAVIIDGLDDLKTVEIPNRQVSYVRSQLTNRNVTVVIRLAAVSADIEQPHMIDKEPFWLLGTKVAAFSLWNHKGRMVYEYTAPWYYAPATETIRHLKTRHEEIEERMQIQLDPILKPIENP